MDVPKFATRLQLVAIGGGEFKELEFVVFSSNRTRPGPRLFAIEIAAKFEIRRDGRLEFLLIRSTRSEAFRVFDATKSKRSTIRQTSSIV